MKKNSRLKSCLLIAAGFVGLSLCVALAIFGLYVKSGITFVQSPVLGDTLTRGVLQTDTKNIMQQFVYRQMPFLCQNPHVVNTEPWEKLEEFQANNDGALIQGKWVERWTVEHCGTQSLYRIEFLADGSGGTNIHVSIWQ